MAGNLLQIEFAGFTDSPFNSIPNIPLSKYHAWRTRGTVPFDAHEFDRMVIDSERWPNIQIVVDLGERRSDSDLSATLASLGRQACRNWQVTFLVGPGEEGANPQTD